MKAMAAASSKINVLENVVVIVECYELFLARGRVGAGLLVVGDALGLGGLGVAETARGILIGATETTIFERGRRSSGRPVELSIVALILALSVFFLRAAPVRSVRWTSRR
ncbi:hypothetical protein LY76DRAFT_270900 [Colletotrichum caudatum]|nr:hypothetical protein LY76DRAFT_270900 [Colletotrichum caudatum]